MFLPPLKSLCFLQSFKSLNYCLLQVSSTVFWNFLLGTFLQILIQRWRHDQVTPHLITTDGKPCVDVQITVKRLALGQFLWQHRAAGGRGGFHPLSQPDSLQYAHLSCASHSKQPGSRETVKYSREVKLRDVMSNTEWETTKEGVYGLNFFKKTFLLKASYKSRTKN